ncbi:MAG TPA: hypothetical protein VLC30_08385 [Pseudomonas sp.]|nr:hypothetical protein [Pseudomonas sp.]
MPGIPVILRGDRPEKLPEAIYVGAPAIKRGVSSQMAAPETFAVVVDMA